MSHRSFIPSGPPPMTYSPPTGDSVTDSSKPKPKSEGVAPIPPPKEQKPLITTPPIPKEIKVPSKAVLDPEIYNWHPKDLKLDPTLLSSEFLKNLPKYLKQDSQEKLEDPKDLDAKTAVKLITLDDLNAPGEYCYLAARKIAQCQFKKEMPTELQAAITEYQNPNFVFQDPSQKQKIIAVLCKHATNKIAAKALERLHLVRSDIKYSIEVEGGYKNKGKRIYDLYGPPSSKDLVLGKDELLSAGIFSTLGDHLTPAGKAKCEGMDLAKLSDEWIKKNLTWFDLSLEGRADYAEMLFPENEEFISYSSALASFRKNLNWERRGEVWELKTDTYYVSLDQLYFSLREVISIFGSSGSYNVHISQNTGRITENEKDVKERAHAMGNVLYGFNSLAMLEHTSKNYFKHYSRKPYSLEALKHIQNQFLAEFFDSWPRYHDEWLSIKLHHIAVVPGKKIYKNSDLVGFEIRSSNRRDKHDTTLLLSLADNASALGDIFASHAWEKIAMPKYLDVFLPSEAEGTTDEPGYAKLFADTPQAKELGLTEKDLISFFGAHDGRIALPLVAWEKFPFFPQNNAIAQENLDGARESAIQELMELAKKKIEDDATIQAPVKKFIETLKDITATSRKKFRNKIAEIALDGFSEKLE